MKLRQGCLSIIAIGFVITTVASFLLPVESLAGEIFPFFRGVRDEAMGEASIAVVNDYTALFLNPAGLGKIRGPVLNIINPELEMDYDLSSALGASYANAPTTPQGFLNIQSKNPDKPFHAKFQVLPSFVTTNFGIGLYGNYTYDSYVTSVTNNFHIDYKNDFGAVVGYCFRLLEGRLKIGASGKILNRVAINTDVPSTSTNLTTQNLAAEGGGAGWDAGVILTGPWTWLPTLSIVGHDIGNTRFNLGSGYFYKTGIQPASQTQSVDAAIAVFPIHSNSTRSSFTIQYNDLQNPESLDIYRRIHAGAEINFSDVLYLRAGLNQRYYTAGLEIDLGHNQFQLATYGEEIGTPTLQKEDRRFVLMYGLRL